MSILVVGSIGLDNIKTPFGKVENILGGSAIHFSYSASFFSPVNVVGVIGEDFPDEHFNPLRERGVDLRGVETKKGKTFRWSGSYDYDLNQAHTLETQLNVLEEFNPNLLNEYEESKFVFLANIDPELQLEVLKQIKDPYIVVGDTMNFWIEHKKDALMKTLKNLDILLMNDSEARELCGTHSLLEAAQKILRLGPSTVIIKKGEHGALMFTDSTHFAAPAYPLEEINDPTGAGDSFAGGFLGHLAQTKDFSEATIRRAVVFGSVMASYNVEDFGPKKLQKLTTQEIEKRYKEFEAITRF
ncbi:MAG TPA: sugar kinase [Actinobacteria bacterium]|nr:sugar kinase [Actinomycetota bacterium]